MTASPARKLRDSSKTRVAPVLDQIRQSPNWVPRLLSLPRGAGAVPLGLDLTVLGCAWGDPEPRLGAPSSLLRWLVQNVAREPKPNDVRHSAAMRRLLRKRDPDTIQAALQALEGEQERGPWWVLEGPTYPDALIETADALIVIEGKRTEREPTRKTTWMPIRDQMLRHMDCAWEVRGRRRVLGFYIVEEHEGTLPAGWRTCARDTVQEDLLRASLPHRSADERASIAAGFLGVTTWQEVCREFHLDPAGLPATIHDLQRGAGGNPPHDVVSVPSPEMECP